MAWLIQGSWFENGARIPLATGDPIEPGALLRPGAGEEKNSITVLMPDGQRFFLECFTEQDCARGFRVPKLYKTPDSFADEALSRVRGSLVRSRSAKVPNAPGQAPLPRGEFVTVLDEKGNGEIKSLAARLPDGHYTYDLISLSHASQSKKDIEVVKAGTSIVLSFPAPGLYEVVFTDDLKTPRIDQFVTALSPAQTEIKNSLHHGDELFAQWNEDYNGWPTHDMARAFAASFFPDAKLEGVPLGTPAGAKAPAKIAAPSSIAAEPEFAPAAGLFKTDLSVTLSSTSPGAKIHFTVDGSQPTASSPIYAAPIVVKGAALTIKAYAEVEGKKDSPAVEGIFRIEGGGAQ